jgi:hypothetical protein
VTSFNSRKAQYSFTTDTAGSWMMVDLGEGGRLAPTLKTHTGDKSLNSAGTTVSWAFGRGSRELPLLQSDSDRAK